MTNSAYSASSALFPITFPDTKDLGDRIAVLIIRQDPEDDPGGPSPPPWA